MKKVLFVNQDIMPYVAETEMSAMGKSVPQKIQGSGCEIRTFMPRWGNINERRGQLHEVIRLSGMNITINDTDHPVIIKVASIAGTRVQVYFIDNEELFSRREQTCDKDGNEYSDNLERAAFFARGVIETIKKLRWIPDVIHCQGWMTSLVPLYLKKAYQNEPAVCNAKVVTSIFSEQPKGALDKEAKACMEYEEISKESLSAYNDIVDAVELAKIAIDNSDGVITVSNDINADILEYAKASDAKCLESTNENFAADYIAFYDSLFE